MNLMKYCRNILKTVLVALVVGLFFFSSASSAYAGSPDSKSISVKDGSFSYMNKMTIPAAGITSVTVDLPPGETGTIDMISITGPGDKLEFGCGPVEVSDGDNLLSICGTSYLDLMEGDTTYKADGSGFSPDPNVTLGVNFGT